MPAGLGLRAIRGGAVAVAIRIDGGIPRPARSTFLATHDPAEPLSRDPYGAAHALVQGGGTRDAAAALVGEGRRRQRAVVLSRSRLIRPTICCFCAAPELSGCIA